MKTLPYLMQNNIYHRENQELSWILSVMKLLIISFVKRVCSMCKEKKGETGIWWSQDQIVAKKALFLSNFIFLFSKWENYNPKILGLFDWILFDWMRVSLLMHIGSELGPYISHITLHNFLRDLPAIQQQRQQQNPVEI